MFDFLLQRRQVARSQSPPVAAPTASPAMFRQFPLRGSNYARALRSSTKSFTPCSAAMPAAKDCVRTVGVFDPKSLRWHCYAAGQHPDRMEVTRQESCLMSGNSTGVPYQPGRSARRREVVTATASSTRGEVLTQRGHVVTRSSVLRILRRTITTHGGSVGGSTGVRSGMHQCRCRARTRRVRTGVIGTHDSRSDDGL